MRFVQETKADAADARLQAMISVTATVIRNGTARAVPLEELVPSDVVPADVRVLTCKDLIGVWRPFSPIGPALDF